MAAQSVVFIRSKRSLDRIDLLEHVLGLLGVLTIEARGAVPAMSSVVQRSNSRLQHVLSALKSSTSV